MYLPPLRLLELSSGMSMAPVVRDTRGWCTGTHRFLLQLASALQQVPWQSGCELACIHITSTSALGNGGDAAPRKEAKEP